MFVIPASTKHSAENGRTKRPYNHMIDLTSNRNCSDDVILGTGNQYKFMATTPQLDNSIAINSGISQRYAESRKPNKAEIGVCQS